MSNKYFHGKMNTNGVKYVLSRMKLDPETGCLIWQGGKTGSGYGMTSVYGELVMVHRYIAISTIEDDDERQRVWNDKSIHVMHTCDNPPCGNWEHLIIGDQSLNMQDAVHKGRKIMGKGQDHNLAKLTDDEVREIRYKYTPGRVSYADLAEEYGVSASNIGFIVTRKSWPHLD